MSEQPDPALSRAQDETTTPASTDTRASAFGRRTSGGRAIGVIALVTASIVPVWALIVTIAGGFTALAWLPVLLVYVIPYNLVYVILLVAATALGIVVLRRRPARRLGQTGLIIVAVQLIIVVAFTVWALSP